MGVEYMRDIELLPQKDEYLSNEDADEVFRLALNLSVLLEYHQEIKAGHIGIKMSPKDIKEEEG